MYDASSRGSWHPGGCQRRFVDQGQRPGIADSQIVAVRSVTPSWTIRNGSDMEDQGLGIVPIIMAAISAAGSLVPALMDKKKKKPEPVPEQSFMQKYGMFVVIGGVGILGVALLLRKK